MNVSARMDIARMSSTTSTPPTRPGASPASDPSGLGNDYDLLTSSDRELIYQTTGQKMQPGFDPSRGGVTSIFAGQIAMDRRLGRLSVGQDVSAAYLKDTARLYNDAGNSTGNPFSGQQMDKALKYLAEHSARRMDVTA